MSHYKYFIAIVINVILICEERSQAQELNRLSSNEMLQLQLNKVQSLNDSLFLQSENLINGKLFFSRGDLVNHPYFIENEWNPGKMWYSGQPYDAEMLKYDLNSDNLINVFHYDSSAFPVYLNKEILKEFEISGHHFRYFDSMELKGNYKFIAGYYEVLYDALTCLYARHEKSIEQNKFTLETEYPLKVTLFIKRGGNYFYIKNQESFLKSLNDHETEIRSFMRANNIRFSVINYEPIIKVLEYLDTLR